MGSVAADDARASFVETQEGRRLVVLWQAMLDHSCDAIYSPELFGELAAKLEAADADFAALAQRGVLSRSRGEQLRALFHARYRYIQSCHYGNRSTIRVSGVEASRTTAQWVIELQLSVLRRQPTSKADRELAEAAIRNLAYELSFLRHLDEFEADSDRRRVALTDKESAGGKVDREAFEKEYQYRRSLLLETYRQKKLSKVRAVEEMVPYILALTRARSLPHTAGGESPRPDS
ncbi:MAG: hypothetical protein MUQ65_10185 [Armatimonadetes bacterium]|nr:hypothetical protein [Armatimonadota bacterium]